jgi:uncharacterized membrane protein
MASESVTPGTPAGAPQLEPRAVGAGRGTAWWSEAWRLFTPSVGVWLLIALIIIGCTLVLAALERIPVLGHLIELGVQVITPALVGGMMLGCRALDRGNPLLVSHLFAGFSQRTRPLIILGLILAGLFLLIALMVFGVMLAIFGSTILGMLASGTDPSQTGLAFSSVVVAILLAILVFLLLLLPLIMAAWFAAPLVMLGGLEPGAALAASFRGCMRNIVPFLIYSLIGILLAIVATIPLGLGWLVLVPVSFASVYASYCDIYEDKDTI